MEMGYDGVLLNTAVALADQPQAMAEAFSLGIKAGRGAFENGMMTGINQAEASSPTVGVPFWHEEQP